ncbi:hypothetical protein, variant [Fonticula alba]|uniref:DUF202 domain-containing protein n=1 Tax=Fonticula alba TaxID=691883 RepID=A0A058ZEV8_FONAL|nr:hypothetical protein, variant [Fonticula alba]KCV72914.1 hypothetical protein, variant [Fonticula alba]|eukprot:XP_009492615.1 hypothetical protein, variant [Fonticula alba]
MHICPHTCAQPPTQQPGQPPANERTFLAWLRTALSLTAVGVALDSLASGAFLPPTGDPPGATPPRTSPAKYVGYIFVGFGIVMLCLATFRYFRVQSLLVRSKFEASRLAIGLVAASSIAAMLAAVFAASSM